MKKGEVLAVPRLPTPSFKVLAKHIPEIPMDIWKKAIVENVPPKNRRAEFGSLWSAMGRVYSVNE